MFHIGPQNFIFNYTFKSYYFYLHKYNAEFIKQAENTFIHAHAHMHIYVRTSTYTYACVISVHIIVSTLTIGFIRGPGHLLGEPIGGNSIYCAWEQHPHLPSCTGHWCGSVKSSDGWQHPQMR